MTGDAERIARIRQAIALHRSGDLFDAAAAWRAMRDVSPDDARALNNLGAIAADAGRTVDAIALFDRALAIEPAYVSAHINRATALAATGRLADAAAGYGHAVALDPGHYAAHRALGLLWLALGRRDRALDHFARTLELRRGEDRTGIADRSLDHATAAKLRHDAGQFRHIAARGREAQRFTLLARSYEAVAAEIAAADGPVALTDDQRDRLGAGYNTPFHLIDAPELPGPAVDPGLADATVEIAPGIARIDGVLTPPALALLRRFLLESTIWYDFAHIDGFLAAYLEDGLACPLLLQIADELRAALPGTFAGHPLSQVWAFKAIEPDAAIDMHADDGAVSVNLWLTPDAASEDPSRGGLLLCPAPPPPDWTMTGYDADSAAIGRFLAGHETDLLTIPYRENRAVLFDSRLFHGSDTPRFAAGYENHRINVTLLFGGGIGDPV